MSRKTTISGLLALCGVALLVQHVAELGSNYHGDHLSSGLLLLTLGVMVWFPPSKPDQAPKKGKVFSRRLVRAATQRQA